MSVISGILGGLLVAFVGSFIIGIAFPSLVTKTATSGMTFTIVLLAVCVTAGIILGVKVPRAAKVWRYVFLTTALLCYFAPISGCMFGASFMSEQDLKSPGAAAGAAIGTGLISGVMGFMGFFIGSIFLIVGLLIGREPKVVYMQAPPPQPPAPPPKA